MRIYHIHTRTHVCICSEHTTTFDDNFYSPGEACSTSGDPDDTNKVSNEENVLPLELVINKDTKSKENHYDSISTDHRPQNFHHKDVTFNSEGAYESATNDTVSNNDSDKLYIPKIEPSDVVLNIEAHLKNGNNRNSSASLQNSHVREFQCVK